MNRTFIATTGRGIERACQETDGTWTVTPALTDNDVRCLATDPLQPGRVYAGTNKHGLLRSMDGGQTWESAGLEGVPIRSVTASPVEPGTVYAGTKPPGLRVSRDAGESWEELVCFQKRRQWWWFTPAEPGAPYILGIALSPTDPAVILAGVEFGAVLRSEDGGVTWSKHRPGALRDCHSLTFHATNGSWVYEGGGSGAGASASQDGGRTWNQTRQGMDAHYGWAVAADPARPEVWYAATAPGPMKAHGGGDAEACIYRSSGGAAWEKIAGPLESMPYALITDPAAPGALIAGLHDGTLMESADHGDTWETLPVRFERIERMMVMVMVTG
jgi:photosystem II stability/assembly factor-like uncharacterized protein